jgi:hypothetical protein
MGRAFTSAALNRWSAETRRHANLGRRLERTKGEEARWHNRRAVFMPLQHGEPLGVR